MIQDLLSVKDIDNLYEISRTEPVFLIKHSTVCGISAAGWDEFQSFARAHTDLHLFRVLVRENRDVSLALSERCGVRHESPQIILFYKGEAVWNTSHFGITQANMSYALDKLEMD